MKSKKVRIGSIVLAMVMSVTMLFGTTLSVSAADKTRFGGELIHKHFVNLYQDYVTLFNADGSLREDYEYNGNAYSIVITCQEGNSGERDWQIGLMLGPQSAETGTFIELNMSDYYKQDKVNVVASFFADGAFEGKAEAAFDCNDYVPEKTKLNWKWFNKEDNVIAASPEQKAQLDKDLWRATNELNRAMGEFYHNRLYYYGFDCYCTGHKYGSWKVVTKPTSKKLGKNVRVCEKCGHEEFKIVPPPTTFKLTKGTKKFKVKWTRKSCVTGYQVKYSTKKSMAKAKTVTIGKKTTSYKTIKKLKPHKRYYVQMRTYKKSGAKKYYSAWSAKKSIRTK